MAETLLFYENIWKLNLTIWSTSRLLSLLVRTHTCYMHKSVYGTSHCRTYEATMLNAHFVTLPCRTFLPICVCVCWTCHTFLGTRQFFRSTKTMYDFCMAYAIVRTIGAIIRTLFKIHTKQPVYRRTCKARDYEIRRISGKFISHKTAGLSAHTSTNRSLHRGEITCHFSTRKSERNKSTIGSLALELESLSSRYTISGRSDQRSPDF